MTALGTKTLDLASQLLGLNYKRFQSPTGIEGLAKEDGKRLDILAVNATKPGTDQFHEFIIWCKAEYEAIYVWEIWNPLLEQILQRYGFQVALQLVKGQMVWGRSWKRA